MFCMSIGKSVFDVIEHCSMEGHPIRRGWVKNDVKSI